MIKKQNGLLRIQAGIIWHNDWFVDGTNLPIIKNCMEEMVEWMEYIAMAKQAKEY